MDATDQTIDLLLTKHREERAVMHFLIKVIRRHGMPEKVKLNGSEANAAAIRWYNNEDSTAITIGQVKPGGLIALLPGSPLPPPKICDRTLMLPGRTTLHANRIYKASSKAPTASRPESTP
jgi:hypothetical protein